MAEKDILEKALMDYNDVFSDILNVLLFRGEEVVHPDELEEAGTVSNYYEPDNHQVHEQNRDTAKYWRQGICLARLGIENQTIAEHYMPLRIINYDAAAYRSQLTKNNAEGEKYPVISLVLHFDYKKDWDQPIRLRECFPSLQQADPVSRTIYSYTQDYGINVFDIAALTPEQVNCFRSDFRVVADFYVQMRRNRKYVASAQQLAHVQEVMSLMGILTGDRKYEELYRQEIEEGRTVNSMCEVLDYYKAIGVQEGIDQGIRKGMAEGLEKGMAEGLEKGMAEGLEKGMAEGLEKGLEKGMAEGLEKGMAEGLEKGLEKGMAEGLEKGLFEGSFRTWFLLIDKGRCTEEEAAAEQGISAADFHKLLDHYRKTGKINLLS